ncbi:MAG: hypothetical protein KGQ47_09145 [Hyphomicrobiales bacterium]|nr:hypothetical protein [Hyphomicrobiales bacterium]
MEAVKRAPCQALFCFGGIFAPGWLRGRNLVTMLAQCPAKKSLPFGWFASHAGILGETE